MTNIVFGQNPKDRIFYLEKNMIQNFDTINFKVGLTNKAKLELSRVDFSKYSYLWIQNTTTLILILQWTTQVRPSNILVYRNKNNNIVDEDGAIRIVTEHLNVTDIRVIDLKKILK